MKEATVSVVQAPVNINSGDCSLVNRYAWDTATAQAICLAESGGRSNAFNAHNTDGSNDAGLMQINSIHVRSGLISDSDRYVPEANMRAAYAIYRGHGFSAWSSYNNGQYRRYL